MYGLEEMNIFIVLVCFFGKILSIPPLHVVWDESTDFRTGADPEWCDCCLSTSQIFKCLKFSNYPYKRVLLLQFLQLRHTILTAVPLCIGRNTQFHIPNAFASLFHG